MTEDRPDLLRQLAALNADIRALDARPDITVEAAEAMTDTQLARAVTQTADHLLDLAALVEETKRRNQRPPRRRRPE